MDGNSVFSSSVINIDGVPSEFDLFIIDGGCVFFTASYIHILFDKAGFDMATRGLVRTCLELIKQAEIKEIPSLNSDFSLN